MEAKDRTCWSRGLRPPSSGQADGPAAWLPWTWKKVFCRKNSDLKFLQQRLGRGPPSSPGTSAGSHFVLGSLSPPLEALAGALRAPVLPAPQGCPLSPLVHDCQPKGTRENTLPLRLQDPNMGSCLSLVVGKPLSPPTPAAPPLLKD